MTCATIASFSLLPEYLGAHRLIIRRLWPAIKRRAFGFSSLSLACRAERAGLIRNVGSYGELLAAD
jgi:hypothetical protein